jgi:two-component system, LuxR family, response regulator FixJ
MRPATVFVVDDDPSMRPALKRLLASAGLSVKTFASAEDFLDGLDQRSAGCLVLDARLTGMSGLELQGRLSTIAPAMPVIVITAVGSAQVEIDSLRAGAVAVLRKPFAPQALLDAIARALEDCPHGGSA